MPKINRALMIVTISIMIGFIFLAFFLYYLFSWWGFFFAAGGAAISQFIILHYFDKRRAAQKRQKISELKIAVKEDITSEIGEEKRLLIKKLNKQTTVTSGVLESFRIYLRINIAEINELILDVDEIYAKCVEFVKKGRTKKAREEFNSKISDTFNRIHQLDTDFNFKIKNLKTTDLKFKKIIDSFEEEWKKNMIKVREVIKQAQDKFEVSTNFLYYIEDIFRFEIENRRRIEKEDLDELKIPKDQIRNLLKYINKSVRIKLSDLNKEKKKKFGEIGKKVITYFSNFKKTPNLPEMVINLGMGITESKEILSYLKEVGMIDHLAYHVE